jgi:uncharacterized protein (UPF0335 family)
MASAIAEKIAERHNAEVRAGNNPVRDLVKNYVDRLDNLETEKAAVASDIRDVKAEAKAQGLDPRALTLIVKRKREDTAAKEKRQELEGTVDQYLHAMGWLD